MPYYLSDKTNNDLQRLIRERRGQSPTGIGAGGGGRHVTFVLVTAGSNNPYTGTVGFPNADGTWVYYSTGVTLKEVNGAKLVVGRYYLAIRTGDDASGNPVYLTTGTAGLGSSSSSGSGAGNSLAILTGVYCDSGGVVGVQSNVTAYVTIGGTNYPVTFAGGGS